MREILKVDLFNEERCYVELTLPASPYTVLDALEKLRLEGGAPYHRGIADKLQMGRLTKHLDQNGSFFELNALCQQLAILDEPQLAVVEGLAKMECKDDASRVPLSVQSQQHHRQSGGGRRIHSQRPSAAGKQDENKGR